MFTVVAADNVIWPIGCTAQLYDVNILICTTPISVTLK